VEKIKEYFGEETGFYFAFLAHMSALMRPLAVPAAVLEITAFVLYRIVEAEGLYANAIAALVIPLWFANMLETWFPEEKVRVSERLALFGLTLNEIVIGEMGFRLISNLYYILCSCLY
jgi:hypothetical protein